MNGNCCTTETGTDYSVTLSWEETPCINCQLVVSTPEFSYAAINQVDTPEFTFEPIALEVLLFPDASPLAMYPGMDFIIYFECSNPLADIHYTVNGADPTESDPLYTGGILYDSSIARTFRYKAFYAGLESAVGTQLVDYSGGLGLESYGFFTKLNLAADPMMTDFGVEFIAAGTAYFFPMAGIPTPGQEIIIDFDQPVGTSFVRHIVLDTFAGTPVSFVNAADNTPITLLGAGDGYALTDSEGNPYAEFTDTTSSNRHYACVATDGLTSGFSVKVTF